MQVSVVIPAYNRAHTLTRALDSVLAQSWPPTEIIVVDDGSTDATPALMREQYPAVRYLRQDNAGVSSARNVGIAASKSEWIALLDSDDAWLPEKLERQMDALAESPEFRLCHTDEIWIRNGRRVNPMQKHAKSGGRIFEQCLPLCVISPSSVVIHRSIFDDLGSFDESLPACEDYDLWLRICAQHPVLYLDQPLLTKYGGHDDQLSQHYPAMDRFRIQALENILDHPGLSVQERSAVADTLMKKLDIYINGARKRGNIDDLPEWETRRRRIDARLSDVATGMAV